MKNAGWLEIPCFGAMVSLLFPNQGAVVKATEFRGKTALKYDLLVAARLCNWNWIYFADRKAASMSSIAIRMR
jgi:hypothetical protein